MAFDPRLRSPKEKPLFVIGVIFSGLTWLALVISIIGLLYGLFTFAFIIMAHAGFLAYVRGNGVRVSTEQLPRLYERVVMAAGKLGVEAVPEVYVLQAGGTLNAFATRLFSRRFVIIYSDLVDNCHDVRHLDFVLGHEIGHLAAGHLHWKTFLLPFHMLPWLGPAYSRACEYTCDRTGHHVVGDAEASMRGLCVLAAGGKLSAEMSLPAFMSQREETGGFWMSIYELAASHPYLCKRVAALHELESPGTLRPVPRHAFGWAFAPVLGITAGGASSIAMVMLIYAGIVLAMAIPGIQKGVEEERARQQQLAAPADFDDSMAEDGFDPEEEFE